MTKRILITVGGTGGHIYPAMAVARELKKRIPDLYVMFAGHGLGENPHFDRQAFPYIDVSSGPFPVRSPWTCFTSLGKLAKGMMDSGKMFRDFKPDLVIGFGSYHTLPTLLAARFCQAPIVLHEANTIPGKVNQLLSRHAVAVATHFPETASYFKGKTVQVGMPVREGYHKGAINHDDALSYFSLECGKPTLLVFGGSQGAHAINRLMKDYLLRQSSGTLPFQVIHLTGSQEHTDQMSTSYEAAQVSACVKNFEKKMDYAWEVADLVIGRSGAGTIAEAIAYEVPALLIPYPHASDDHQVRNALFMQNVIGGAVMLLQEAATSMRLQDEIANFFAHDCRQLKAMKENIAHYKKEQTSTDFCTLIQELLIR
ncbi:MAG: undecaprenyldiphospho-muramoylpentapeptide beta-N-acetylglucosaminyltransferase [Chlamydiales bacterium]|nr:undecaprenyldiphospho-muramoylpentapeptide beta-N-acetylglucosaminyltransferase [Chlamydiia bacterium]MCP5507261.1 undecaprenyldiphospho-muramoylpentapeptide beta-N-acetylglucosaminyltransferase [Chlamydiales bacterium]